MEQRDANQWYSGRFKCLRTEKVSEKAYAVYCLHVVLIGKMGGGYAAYYLLAGGFILITIDHIDYIEGQYYQSISIILCFYTSRYQFVQWVVSQYSHSHFTCICCDPIKSRYYWSKSLALSAFWLIDINFSSGLYHNSVTPHLTYMYLLRNPKCLQLGKRQYYRSI